MIPRTDSTNFNRFLTSMGVLLVAVALICPYFYYRTDSALLLSAKEIQALTISERELLIGRQHTIAWLEVPVLALSGLLFLGGIACVVSGGVRLHTLQGKEDAAMDRRAEQETAAIKDQTDAEREKRLDMEAREASKSQHASKKLGFDESRRVVGRIEQRLDESLQGEDFDPYEFLADVKVVGDRPDREIAIDGLFSSGLPDVPDVLLQRRLVLYNPERRTQRYGDTMLALLARYRKLTGRDVVGWLVIILSHQAKELPRISREGLRAEFDRALAGLGRTTILGEDELAKAPSHVRELFIA